MADPSPPTVPSVFLLCVAVAYLFWGTAQTLSLKWADSLSAPDGYSFTRSVIDGFPYFGEGGGGALAIEVTPLYSFGHPFSQAFFMFCSETICLFVFLGNLALKKYRSGTLFGGASSDPKHALVVGEDVSLPLNPCVFLLSCGADFLASIIQNVGMMLTYASVYQMLRGATVVWIAVISYFWLKRRFTKVKCWGMGCVVLGLTLVGLSGILKNSVTVHADSSATEAAKNPLLGNILVISAQILHAYQGVCQERLFRLYKVPPLQMVGVEGIYGIGLTLSLLAFLQLVPMSLWGHNLVGVQERFIYPSGAAQMGIGETVTSTGLAGIAASSGGNDVFLSHNISWVARGLLEAGQRVKVPYDDVVLAFTQMSLSRACLASILIYIPAGFFYNACQLTIIKYLSAAATVMLGSLRNITVWVACLLIPSVFGESFSIVQFIGFIFLAFGNVLFQKVWIRSFSEVLPARVLAACPVLFVDRASGDAEKPSTDVVVEAHEPAQSTDLTPSSESPKTR